MSTNLRTWNSFSSVFSDNKGIKLEDYSKRNWTIPNKMIYLTRGVNIQNMQRTHASQHHKTNNPIKKMGRGPE